jgi:3'-phosphoadenosine 5'-phosphosulfate sulfotransferase (PAPS reductase)/FAD synthetase
MNNLSLADQNTLAKWALRMRRKRKKWFNIKAILAASAAEDHVSACYSDGEVALLQGRRGHCVIHPSTKSPGEYQVTYCNDSGFISDSTFESIRKAVKQCLIEGYRTRLERGEADALMLATVEAESRYQMSAKIATIQRTAKSHGLAIDAEIAEMIAGDAVVAFGASGGKDSEAMALATSRFLDEVRHAGPRVLIHADLGQIEHADSLPQCRRLAERLGLELIVVRRKKGGMIERWEQRWSDNVARYVNLECVTLITPWSSKSMRFCTSELKVDQITRALATRFHGRQIINAVGLRREESDDRAQKPISQEQKKLLRKGGRGGRDWYPILDWPIEEVLLEHERSGFGLHYGYRINGNKRISCSVCVLSSLHDLQASLKDERNHDSYRRVVDLEIASAFSFQPSRWLADVRPDLLSQRQRESLEAAKEIARRRRQVEARIPKEMLFVKRWPTFVPSIDQCGLLAEVRLEIGSLTGIPVRFTEAQTVQARYEELYAEKLKKKEKAPARPA